MTTEATATASEATSNIVRDALQTQAIDLCLSTEKRIVAVSGQAGTGKTSIMKEVYNAFTAGGHFVALAAPTGKAAKRIGEATGIDATTIHRLLEFTHPGDPDEKTGKVLGVSVPKRKPSNPLAQDVILVDEYSMVHSQLHRDLVDAMPPGCLLRVFGDANQLPPIEGKDYDNLIPSPFETLLKDFEGVKLTTIYRQGEGSEVVAQAHRILQGWMPTSSNDFQIKWAGLAPKNQVNIIEDLVMAGDVDYASLDNQIITPANISWIGTTALNKKIQDLLMGDKMSQAFVMPRNKWAKGQLLLVPGDKVVWTNNDYQLNIFNGETGIVEHIDDGLVQINFGDRVVDVPPQVTYIASDGSEKWYDPRKSFDLAYVLTTHKCQGSEYGTVVYVMDKSVFRMLNRGNFYTAVTRARKRVIVVSDQRSVQTAVSTRKNRL